MKKKLAVLAAAAVAAGILLGGCGGSKSGGAKSSSSAWKPEKDVKIIVCHRYHEVFYVLYDRVIFVYWLQ